ncbi:NADPH oxidase 4 [Lates japonicus]|uniref:NADPH oxidase 4 n=1 Tax=Lates japonicus TaxID=270547 RepID=A0AAD3MNS9_LATJO|nr:NADPH oxidase 4 [Lates japonicus]
MVVSLRSWVANEGGKHLVLMLWLGANTWLFLKTFLLYSTGQQYHYLYKMLGLSLCISRASASVLNLNCSLVLLPMCRSLLTFFRGTHTVSNRKTRRLLDKSKTFHVACGVAICIFSVVHVSAHLVNDPKLIILTTIPGITGVLLVVLILFLMFTSHSSYCAKTWLWVSGPLCLYCAERFYRYIRSSHPITIVTVIRHPCDVIELRMLKKNFKARPGQYILLNCPGVSSFENHPFTLTTCPTENKETFGIHLRVVGDWTGVLQLIKHKIWPSSTRPVPFYRPPTETSTGFSFSIRSNQPLSRAEETNSDSAWILLS